MISLNKVNNSINNKLLIPGFLDSLGDGISIQDTAFRILYQNQAQRDFIGEHLGEYCYDAYEGRKKICRGCPVAKTFKDGKSHKTVRSVSINKGFKHFEITASPLKDSKGEIIAGVEVVRDVTERIKSEENLLKNEDKLQRLANKSIMELSETNRLLHEIKNDWEDTFHTIDDMITIHDKDFNIIKANKAAKKILNIPSLLTKKKCFRFYHGTDKPPDGCPSCNCLESKKPAFFELYEPHLKKHIEIRAIPRFDRSKKLIGLIHIVRDITKRKKMETSIIESRDGLKKKTNELKEINSALKVLLKQREKDKKEFEENILSNVKTSVIPYLDKLNKIVKNTDGNGKNYLNIMETNLQEIISPLSRRLSSTYIGLSHREIQIANLIKEGRQTKEIAELLNLSHETVNSHRQKIRKKMGLKNRKMNLIAYLSMLEE
jgi:DNA-binding CsgD family transcriptional regulator/PAS domain-containing protein